MDTAHKVSLLAAEQGLDLVATGVPKTIDNDVGDPEFKLIDHTPGYGSRRPLLGLQRPGRQRGERGLLSRPTRCWSCRPWAARSASSPPRRGWPTRTGELPLQIYMAESGVTLDELADNVNDELKRSGRCIVVVSEGFDVGDIGAQQDGFGHIEFGASDLTAQQAVVYYLNRKGLAADRQGAGPGRRAPTSAIPSIARLPRRPRRGLPGRPQGRRRSP